MQKGDLILVKNETYGIVIDCNGQGSRAWVDYRPYGSNNIWCANPENCEKLERVSYWDIDKTKGRFCCAINLMATDPNIHVAGALIGESDRITGCIIKDSFTGNLMHLNMGNYAIYTAPLKTSFSSSGHVCNPINMGFNHIRMVCPECDKHFPDLDKSYTY